MSKDAQIMFLKGCTDLSLKGHGDSMQSVTTAEREMSHPYSKKVQKDHTGKCRPVSFTWMQNGASSLGAHSWAHKESEFDERVSVGY